MQSTQEVERSGEHGRVIVAAVRIRGLADVNPDVNHTLNLLRLRRRFTCSVYVLSDSIKGMLKSVESWATWGELSRDTLIQLLRRRGRITGDLPLTDEYLKKYGWGSVEELVDAYIKGEVKNLWCSGGEGPKVINGKASCIPGLKPFFRLHPPKGGFKGSIKKPYGAGGELGYRGLGINELILRMI
ncbi:50S ribosomal protein L30 [Caldivirga sp. UBA161]|uniref:50S ribosomal protein L30 n=1 Tax=Caldivirga sp. UBA161 TaxID=1915569 RepID=UPI0025BDFDA4|nr:50S ribosomal protein L30 [Caldivirga sp. UBA161]